MKTFLNPTDPDAFVDYPLQSAEEAATNINCTHLCPKCKGHGGWNLELNAYPLNGKEDTPENRHKHSHFRAFCSQCEGWGYVREEDQDHVHDWVHARNVGNCLNVFKCSICDKEREVDSSD